MPKQKITGSFVALITPFNKDGSVDFAAFRSLLHFQEEHGTKAVLIMGSTGETSMLSAEERREIVVETAKMKSGNMPIFFGCTGNNTETTIANVRFAKDNGADGAILAAPIGSSITEPTTPTLTSTKAILAWGTAIEGANLTISAPTIELAGTNVTMLGGLTVNASTKLEIGAINTKPSTDT